MNTNAMPSAALGVRVHGRLRLLLGLGGITAGLLLTVSLPAIAGTAEVTPTRLTGDGFSGGAAVARSVLGLVVIVAALLTLAWFARRFGGLGQARGRGIQVLAALPVGNRERVLLVRVGEEQILIGVAPGRVQALHVLDRPLEDLRAIDDAASLDQSFAGRLKTALGTWHS